MAVKLGADVVINPIEEDFVERVLAETDGQGGNLYLETRSSGDPLIGAANTGNRGAVHSYSLEQSNVDLAEQYVHLITAQRGFQANSKVITTSDQMLSEVVNIKR